MSRRFAGFPAYVSLSRLMTRASGRSRSSRSMKLLPIKPLPPVTRYVAIALSVRHFDAAVVAEGKAVDATRTMAALELNKAANHAFRHRPVKVLKAAVFHDDTVFDAAAHDPAARVDRTVRADIGVDDGRVAPDYQRAPQYAVLNCSAALNDYRRVDTGFLVDGSVTAWLHCP